MFENMDNLKLIGALQGIGSIYNIYRNRPSHAFVFRLTGAASYKFADRIITHSEGEMLFIPEGSSYDVRQISEGESQYALINFEADIPNAVPGIYAMEHVMDARHTFATLYRLWLFPNQAGIYKCYSIFYDILSHVAAMDNADYSAQQKFEKIEPAVSYLKAHIFDVSLNIHDLHKLCGISDTYFRNIFHARFGTSPQSYVINKRLTQAKTIIENGDYDNLYDVALAVGYEDALYFSRVFKRKYGMAPSRVGRNNIN